MQNKKAGINTKSVRESHLEQYLIDNMQCLVKQQLHLLTEGQVTPKKDNSKQIIEKIHTKLERLKKLYLDEIISIDEYKKDREELIAALQELEVVKEVDNTETIANLKDLLDPRLFDHYHELKNADKAKFWRKIIKRIEFDNDKNYFVEFN